MYRLCGRMWVPRVLPAADDSKKMDITIEPPNGMILVILGLPTKICVLALASQIPKMS